ATFTDTDPTHLPYCYAAVIDWGDGSSSPGTIVAPAEGGDGSYTVSGSHTYAAEGVYLLTVTVSWDDVNTATGYSTAVVNDALLHLTAQPIMTAAAMRSDDPFSPWGSWWNSATVPDAPAGLHNSVVATFTNDNPNDPAGAFTATIDW